MEILDYEGEEQLKYVVMLVTAASREEGLAIARRLVEEGLAACVNLLDGILSVFRWKGKVEESPECLLIIKTRTERINEVIQRVKAFHSYDVPEIIALPILVGNPPYLQWIDEVT